MNAKQDGWYGRPAKGAVVKRKFDAIDVLRRELAVEPLGWYATTFTGLDVVLLRRLRPNDPTPFSVGFFHHESGEFERFFETRDRNEAVTWFSELCKRNGWVDDVDIFRKEMGK